MPSMRGFLRSKSKTDDDERELAESQLVARLAGLFGELVVDPVDADGQDSAEAATNGATLSHEVAVLKHVTNGARPAKRPLLGRPPIIVIGAAEPDGPDQGVEPVGVMARAGDDVGEDSWQLPARAKSAPVSKPARKRPSRARRQPVKALQPVPGPTTGLEGALTPLEQGTEPATTTAVELESAVVPLADLQVAPTLTLEAALPVVPASVGSLTKRSHKRRPVLVTTAATGRPVVVSAAHCPYCGVLLDPPPASSRKCDECQQRIIVKRIDSRAVYLAGAALPVFAAERRRLANSARLTRERNRWLDLAAAAGAPSRGVAQLRSARASDANVAAARALYVLAVERTFRMAKRDKEWDAAARLRRDEAIAIYRAEGSRRPPSAEVVRLYQDGVAAELRGIAEISRDAQLLAASCCEACRADDELVTRIAAELRQPRLPHAGCPRGLCRCHWDLAARDRTTIRRYLRRRSPSESRVTLTEPSPAR